MKSTKIEDQVIFANANDKEFIIRSFNFLPPEPMTWDYPGCDADVEILEVDIVDGDIIRQATDDEIDENEEYFKERIMEEYERRE